MRDDAVFEFECRVSGVVGGAFIGLALLRPSASGCGWRPGRRRLSLPKKIIEDIAPVAEHVKMIPPPSSLR